MQELRDLILNLSLLVTLAVVYQIAVSRHTLALAGTRAHVLVGVAFGVVAVVGMAFPLTLIEGLIFDGRSVILSLAGLFGGPLVAGIAAIIAGAYRYWLGGPGMPVGIATIMVSAALGIAFHYLWLRKGAPLTAGKLYGFGLLVQVVVLVLFTFLPNGLDIVERLGPILLVTYPLATLFIGLLFRDYEAQARTREHLHELAYYDGLTGLPNRAFLIERLAEVMGQANPLGQIRLLAILNIDRFKTINDARGHAMGDALLRAIGQRLQGQMGPADTLARMGSDEFALLLLRPAASLAELIASIEELARRISAPIQLHGEELGITVSLGAILLLPGSPDSAGEALRRADTALHQAKLRGGNRCVFFDAAMSAEVEHRFAIERALRAAVPAGQLRLFLQSQFDPNGRLVGAEALVRWQHPEQGLLAPAAFIPIAEESDLIVLVGEWVFREACRLLSQSPLREQRLSLSVNISARHFHQANFVPWIEATLRETGADPKRIILEITESLLLEDKVATSTKMNALARLGLRFSIDDFGTGYSSLYYLKRLPIHEIKIDKSFVQDAPTDPNDATLVETMLAIAERLSLEIVAEGVETEAQARFLDARGQVIRQGYLYAQPEPAEDWIKRLA